MFTGLIEAVGRVAALDHTAGGTAVTIATGLACELAAGDSLAVNGVCLTVTSGTQERVSADIGPETAARLAAQLKSAGTIVWNGPVGVFEFAAFENGTREIAKAIAESPAFSIAGGGDTLAAIAKYGIEKQVGYISTGGGAFLEVLEGKTLPAFEILEKRFVTIL